jgi:hypothetical protein
LEGEIEEMLDEPSVLCFPFLRDSWERPVARSQESPEPVADLFDSRLGIRESFTCKAIRWIWFRVT